MIWHYEKDTFVHNFVLHQEKDTFIIDLQFKNQSGFSLI